jgi:hypothetical protein
VANALENPRLCSVITVGGRSITITLNQDEAAEIYIRAITQQSALVAFPTIAGKVVLGLGAVEGFLPYQRKEAND